VIQVQFPVKLTAHAFWRAAMSSRQTVFFDAVAVIEIYGTDGFRHRRGQFDRLIRRLIIGLL
jgi:hypothetical protein